MRTARLIGAVATAAALAVGGQTSSAGAAGTDSTLAAAGPHWAPAASATVHPGVKVTMGGVACIAGFVFTDGTRAFIAVPASCSGAGEVANPKCDAGQDPLGLPVTIQGAKHKGTLVYSSVTAMELRSQSGANRCQYNNLSLVRLDRRDIKRTNPSVPEIGGPTGVSKDQPALPDQLMVYLAAPTSAQAIESGSGGWAHTLMVDGAVSPNDLGGPALTDSGQALGMVSGTPMSDGSTTVSNLHREVRYLHTYKRFADVHLAKGTEKFKGSGLPAIR
ncbi:MAG TPA: hypothetical protein VIH10_19075 [Kribbella sp.]